MKQTLRFGRQRCERYEVATVYSYAINMKSCKSVKRVGARIFS
jgi:hypothetical protein